MSALPALQAKVNPVEILKPTVSRNPGGDPLDLIISPYYISRWSPRPLRLAVAPLSLTLVVISRYYGGQKVAVDFEEPGRLFHEEAKRKWCHEQGIVYVPIRKAERLTAAEFQVRLDKERAAFEKRPKPAPPPPTDPVGVKVLETEPALEAAAEAHLQKSPSLKGIFRKNKGKMYVRMLREHLRHTLEDNIDTDIPTWLAEQAAKLPPYVSKHKSKKVNSDGVDGQ